MSGCCTRTGGGHVPRWGEAEFFDRELEHVDQEPLMVGPRPRGSGGLPAPDLAVVVNVYEHAAKSATAELSLSWVPGDSLTVEVRDQDSRMPRRRRTAELGVLPFALIDTDANDWRIMQLAEAGRGLALVDALCDRLTWQPNSSGGKVVRCHWRLKASTDTARNNPQPSDRSEG